MNFPEQKSLDLAATAQEILQFWNENNIFERSVNEREGAPSFTFFEGPPSANGTPGIHHVMARTIKDVFCRYKTLQGFQVKRKGGWDTHGLPVELQVEKELGITKEDIGTKISVEEYNRKCRESVMKFKGEWDDLTQKMGYWVDLNNPYITFENDYIESCWALLKRLFEKDLLYKGYTIQPYSPAAGTGLSSHELNQPGCYRDVKDTSIVAQFKVKNTPASKFLFEKAEGELFILAWTTTPWTLPSNAALAVGEKIQYVSVATFNPYTFVPVTLVLAKALVGKYFSEKAKEIEFTDYKAGDKLIPWKITGECTGAQLVGIEYEQLLPYVQPAKPAFRVIPGDFVSTEDGTGIVHIAPTFGADDKRVADQAGIPPIVVKDENGYDMPLVDKRGRFVKEVTDYALDFVKEEYLDQKPEDYKSVDVRISIKLKEENRAFKVEKYEHSYPHCWRTDKPVLYYPMESWFIKTTAFKDKMVAINKTINWKPESTGAGRFGHWLENLVDWNLSRSRFWGTPLPVWVSEDRTEMKCIGSVAELNEEINKAISAGVMSENPLQKGTMDLHRPYVDRIVLVSPSGKAMQRESDLIDVWFDSGAMPYAQWHYPFENEDIFNNSYPADFISEGVDQTRGWFFTLHALAVMLFDKPAFTNVVSTGLVLDKNGEKMSKRKGNVINPFEALDKYGADAVRWYMVSNANPWDNLKFDLGGVEEVRRKLFGTLHNTYNFFALYANLDAFKIEKAKAVPVAERSDFDRWILSELQLLIKKVSDCYEDYDVTGAARAIESFTDEYLSNWYVRLSRKRFWKGEFSKDKQAAFETLHECLFTVAQLMSPTAPFFAEKMYKNLVTGSNDAHPASVHLTDLVKAKDELIAPDLNTAMELARRVCSLIHSVRKNGSLRVRLPLAKVYVNAADPELIARLAMVEKLILEETNIKEIVKFDRKTAGKLFTKSLLPDLKKLGKALGPKIGETKQLLAELSQDAIFEFEETGKLTLTFADGTGHELSLEDVIVKTGDAAGMASASDGEVTVALDTRITDELYREGIARDFVNRVQNLRKEAGFEVQDKIKITVEKKDEAVNAALTTHQAYICSETQALDFALIDQLTGGQAVDMDDFELKMEVVKV